MKNLTKILLLIILFSCMRDMKINYDATQKKPLQETDNIKFKKSWVRWDKPNSSRLYDYFVKKTEEINNIPCQGRLTLDSLGNLYGFVFSEDYIFHGNMIPKGSRYEGRVHKNRRNGYMIFLSRDTEIQGLMVRSKGKGVEDYKLDFYRNHKLRGFKLVNDTEINGVPCKGGKNDYVILYPNGNLGECTLSSDFVSENEVFLADTRIMIGWDEKIYKKKNSPIKIDFYMSFED